MNVPFTVQYCECKHIVFSFRIGGVSEERYPTAQTKQRGRRETGP